MTAEIETLSSRIAYRNRWIRVREDEIRRADGSTGLYGVVERADFAVIVPLEADGSLHLVEQYRYPVGGRYWELPQGAWEDRPGVEPATLARGELQEETGLVAGRMTHLGHLLLAPGLATQGYDVFLAEDPSRTETALEVEEQGLIARRFTRAEVEAMIDAGAIKDATTIAALALMDRRCR
ncbi:NUDIX hydrolase [Sphingomonas sp. KR1UV-12]|uniref:GDP-mannose pyrophosphatase n=1 Tax=Sphingomonas aurea TaxID=3063994 RepID=A0ABT9EN77_9SPHN|nr:NUDIX hydrolase [Sphingomonas sp. KR1UV-12]MDP1028413.1 NUDIX hydrolase [Sphingomonas sp. KR1UV-12]